MRVVYYISFILILIGCERDIPIDDLDFNKKLVVNSQNTCDSTIKLQIGTTVQTVETPYLNSLNGNVTVLLKKNGNPVYGSQDLMTNGVLEIPNICAPGNGYEIELAYGDFPTVSAFDSVPNYKPVFQIDTLKKTLNGIDIEINLNDDSKLNKYLLQLYSIGKEWDGFDSIVVKKPLVFSTTDKIFVTNLRTITQANSYAIFNDELLFGTTNNFVLNVSSDSLETGTYVAERLKVSISCISERMYSYYDNLLQNTHVYGGPLENISSDYGNVDQGLGIFCFMNTRSTEIKLQK